MSQSRRGVAIPRLIPPSDRLAVGGLYSAKLLFEFCVYVSGDPGTRRLCEERLIVIEATSAVNALREAERQGRSSQFRYRNTDGNPVHFRLVGVLDLCHLGIECEPNEVWYAIGERVRPMERRAQIIPRRRDLNAIRNEKLLRKRKTRT